MPIPHRTLVAYVNAEKRRRERRGSALELFLADAGSDLLDWWDFTDRSTLFQDTGAATRVSGGAQLVKRVDNKRSGGSNLTEGTNPPAWVEASGAVRPSVLFDGLNDILAASITANADESIIFVIKSTDTKVVLASGQTTARYIFAADSSSSLTTLSANAGTPTVWVDGTQYTQRDTLQAAACDGSFHFVEMRNVATTGWTAITLSGFLTGSFGLIGNMQHVMRIKTGTWLTANRALLQALLV